MVLQINQSSVELAASNVPHFRRSALVIFDPRTRGLNVNDLTYARRDMPRAKFFDGLGFVLIDVLND
jgi:hypothetical protein